MATQHMQTNPSDYVEMSSSFTSIQEFGGVGPITPSLDDDMAPASEPHSEESRRHDERNPESIPDPDDHVNEQMLQNKTPDAFVAKMEPQDSQPTASSISSFKPADPSYSELHSTSLTQNDAANNSLDSSLSARTDASDLSSLPSSFSSKATTPVGTDSSSRSRSHEDTNHSLNRPYSQGNDRLAFFVQPKSSVPSDLSPQEYANECITAAESSRLNPYALHPDEYILLRYHISHTQVTTYLNIRNGILRLWLKQPWIGVTRQEAVGCANARWFDAASVCYDWLVRHGYINFGCVDVSAAQPPNNTTPSSSTRRRKTIAVIGAGISGLACARQLECLFKQYADRFRDQGQEPPRVVVLEGRNRVGGRVYSREFKTQPRVSNPEFRGKRHTAEMGGMIITGFDRGNPVNILVRGQLGLPYHGLSAETTIYDSNGQPADPERDQLVEKLYNDCLDRVSEYKYKSRPSKLIEGNRELIDEGRDSLGDGSKSIIQAEEATAALPDAPAVAEQSVPTKVDMIPVASDKLTGRVYTEPGVPGTVKAAEKARQMGWRLQAGVPRDGDIDLQSSVRHESSTLGSVLDYAIEQYKGMVGLDPRDYRLINWHIANLEYSNATNLHNLSIGLWDIDAGNEWDGPHTMVVGGYQSVARGLLHCPSPLDLTSRFAVKRIQYHNTQFNGPATIEAEDGTVVEADGVVCTIPLGVLKQGNVEFDPPLPEWKTQAIDRLGFGVLNKVVLVYDRIFWEADRHIFGVLRDSPNATSTLQAEYGLNRGRFFQWFNVTNTTGLPCLIALMAGDAGFETEKSQNDDLVAEATEILKGVFGKEVPDPVEAIVTRWGSDRFARGSYSSAAPNMKPEDYDLMAKPIGNLAFAGEHTIGTHPATVHGAYLSGVRAASEILTELIGPIEVPTPLILPRDSLLLQKRKEAAKDPRQARIDAYETEVWNYVRSQIGDRPARPAKVAGNAYLLFSKARLEDAKKLCDETRNGNAKPIPNEVRVMTSRMWKDASPEEKKPYEDQAMEQKKAYTEALQQFVATTESWDLQAISLRADYEKEHPLDLGDGGDAKTTTIKHRRGRMVSYAEEGNSDMDF